VKVIHVCLHFYDDPLLRPSAESPKMLMNWPKEEVSLVTKQARALSDARIKQALKECRGGREMTMVLLSVRAGLRAKEIAGLSWKSVDFEGEALRLTTTKGGKPREVPIHPDLLKALEAVDRRGKLVFTNSHTRGGKPLTANAVNKWFADLYQRRLGWEGYSSHSGRRTFCTAMAKTIGAHGGSLQDVKALMGHSFLSTTARYIEKDEEAQRKAVRAQ